MTHISEANGWRLRKATTADRGAALAMLRGANLPSGGVEDRFPAGYIIAQSGGALIAVAGLEPYGAFGLLRSMAVSREWRRRGIGKALTERLLALAQAMGLEAVYLLTTTAQAYFARMGFALIDRKDVPAEIRASVEFASACPASAVCMFRKLARQGDSRVSGGARSGEAEGALPGEVAAEGEGFYTVSTRSE